MIILRTMLLCSLLATVARGADESVPALQQLTEYLSARQELSADVLEQPFASAPLTAEEAAAARTTLWHWHAETIRATRAEEMRRGEIELGDLKMPFFMRKFGDRPKDGWSLCISMHGGGGAPARVNDSQWENQKRLYQLEEGIYLVPRAPTNTWNLWHQANIDRFFSRLIENLIVLEGVNPDRVYLMGYSAGGDGVYQLAPRMADRFAAAAMMAGHPNETSPLGLRNLPLTIHVGELDAGYNRNRKAAEWKDMLAELHADDPDGYRHLVRLHTGKGHWMDRDDAEALDWMASFRRCVFPQRVVWKQDDVRHPRFYWLAAVPGAVERPLIVAERDGQSIRILQSDVEQVTVLLNDDMLDPGRPVSVHHGETELFHGTVPRTIATMAQSLLDRGDPRMVFSGTVTVTLPPAAAAE